MFIKASLITANKFKSAGRGIWQGPQKSRSGKVQRPPCHRPPIRPYLTYEFHSSCPISLNMMFPVASVPHSVSLIKWITHAYASMHQVSKFSAFKAVINANDELNYEESVLRNNNLFDIVDCSSPIEWVGSLIPFKNFRRILLENVLPEFRILVRRTGSLNSETSYLHTYVDVSTSAAVKYQKGKTRFLNLLHAITLFSIHI